MLTDQDVERHVERLLAYGPDMVFAYPDHGLRHPTVLGAEARNRFYTPVQGAYLSDDGYWFGYAQGYAREGLEYARKQWPSRKWVMHMAMTQAPV